MNRRRNREKRLTEAHQVGPFIIKRQGRVVELENRMTAEQHLTMIKRMADSHDEVCAAIDATVGGIRGIIAQHDPRDILQRAFWERVHGLLNVEPHESALGPEHANDQRMLDYLHAVIVGTPPLPTVEPITNDTWKSLREEVSRLYDLMLNQYLHTRSARARLVDRRTPEQESAFTSILVHWMCVRGKNYVALECEHLLDLLRPHSDVLQRVYGMSAEGLVAELSKILRAHASGCLQAFQDLRSVHAEWARQVDRNAIVERITQVGESAALTESMAVLGLTAKMDGILGRIVGHDLFDVGKLTTLPEDLLRDLSLGPGEDTTFFAAGSEAGWPTRRPPTWDKPLLRIEDHYYCFEQYALFDHIYRTLRRRILEREPEYGDVWNSKQKEVSERLPLELLKKILPGAEVLQSPAYQFRDSGTGSLDWADVDGLVLYGDMLIAVEVKAGSFIGDPPTPDLQDYEESIQDLLKKPAKQGQRFVETLNASGSLPLYDKRGSERTEVKSLISRNYARKYVIVVTVDQLTHLATSLQHLQAGGTTQESPVWRVSLGDLRVYAEILRNPLVFCHFIEFRMRAYHAKSLPLEDDLEHLGMYLATNNYIKMAEGVAAGVDRMYWTGYCDVLDEYFVARMSEAAVRQPPQQSMPELLRVIIDKLAASSAPDRRRVACHLLDMDGASRTGLCEAIENSILVQQRTGKTKSYSTSGMVRVTVFTSTNTDGSKLSQERIDHALSCLDLGTESWRVLLCLRFSSNGQLCECEGKIVNAAMITPENRGHVEDLAEQLRSRRIKASQEQGKIGRNQSCPCGSSRKYKKCCEGRTRAKGGATGEQE